MSDPATSSTVTEHRPPGGRKGGNRTDDDLPVSTNTVPTAPPLPDSGMMAPGKTPDKEEKESLKIKIHLNLHAKVKLELDAQLYGDVVIGLL